MFLNFATDEEICKSDQVVSVCVCVCVSAPTRALINARVH